jgi:dTDP-4-amino-4,6-dideoxygalactose transaminase
MLYVLFGNIERRSEAIESLNQRDVTAVFHYIPLHSSPAGLRFGRAHGDMSVTDDASDRLLRLPLYVDMTEADTQRVIQALVALHQSQRPT